MSKVITLLYGVLSYTMFLGVFIYMVGFLGNFGVPRAIDGPPIDPFLQALLINAGLVAIFGLQHSIMARPWFKQLLTKIVPEAAERSTYVLFTNFALILLYWQWRPMGGEVWDVQSSMGRWLLYSAFAAGWMIVLATTFMINHFDLFGLRQVWLHFRGKEYSSLGFVTPGPYSYIRHPLYVGWFTVFWATPTMTMAHLAFALTMTAYILIAIPFEERDLVEFHGEEYEDYRSRTPKFLPGGCASRKGSEPQLLAEAETS
jgi:protein-S-isoprenylcysteine O-methyltransferase Ste14